MRKKDEISAGKQRLNQWWKSLLEWGHPLEEDPDGVKEKEYERMRQLFLRVDEQVRRERLYLIPEMSLVEMARRVGTNRTYLSRAMSVSGEKFRDYLFRLRMEELDRVLEDENRRASLEHRDIDLYSVAGFRDERTLNRRLLLERGITYGQLIKGKDNS